MFATCSTLELDPSTGSLTIHLAGHHEPLLLEQTEAAELPAAHGIALGIVPGLAKWTPSRAHLPSGAALLLYTDGLNEGRTGHGNERLGTAGLIDLVRTAPSRAPDELLDHLVDSARALNAGRHADDMAVLHLTWN